MATRLNKTCIYILKEQGPTRRKMHQLRSMRNTSEILAYFDRRLGFNWSTDVNILCYCFHVYVLCIYFGIYQQFARASPELAFLLLHEVRMHNSGDDKSKRCNPLIGLTLIPIPTFEIRARVDYDPFYSPRSHFHVCEPIFLWIRN